MLRLCKIMKCSLLNYTFTSIFLFSLFISLRCHCLSLVCVFTFFTNFLVLSLCHQNVYCYEQCSPCCETTTSLKFVCSCSASVDEAPFPLQRSPAWGGLSLQDYHYRRIPQMPDLWSLDRGLWGDAGSVFGTQTVLTISERLSHIGQDCILLWAQTEVLSVRAVHVPGHLNLGVDLL